MGLTANRRSRQRRGWFGSRIGEREVAPGWTALLVPALLGFVFAFGSYSGGLMPWLGRTGVLAWVGVAALAITGFAAAYAATEPGPPLVQNDRRRPVLRQLGGPRVLALALVFVCVFFLKGLGAYVSNRRGAEVAEMATWWGIPFALCFWTLAALTIARETEQAGVGKPAAPQRMWRWLASLRERRSVRIVAYVFLFGGTLAFTVMGSIPGVIWETTSGGPVTWRGYIREPVSVSYIAFFLWAGALVVAAWIYLLQAFHARPSGLPHEVVAVDWVLAGVVVASTARS